MSDDFNRVYNGIGFRPQATDPTNPIDGDIFFSNGSPRSKGFHKWQDGQWQVLGGSGGGGLDVFFKEDHEVNGIGDYTDGNNATVDGGGTLDGTLALETSAPIAGSQSAKYTMGASSTDDYILGISVALDEKQKNKEIAFTQYYKYDGADNDIKAFLYDVTNAEIIPGTTINLPAQANSKRLTIQAFIKDSIDNVKIGYQVLVGNNGKILIWDDIEGTGNPLVFTEIVSENVFSARVTSADTVTTENENFIASVSSSSTGIYIYTFVTGFFSVIPSINVTAETASLYAAIVAESTTGFTVQFRTDAGTLTDTDQAILIQRQGDDYTPPQEALVQNSTEGANLTVYTPVFTGFGTPTNIDIKFYKTFHGSTVIIGKFTTGTTTAVEGKMTLPSGMVIKSGAPIKLAGQGNISGTGTEQYNVLATGDDAFLNFAVQSGSTNGLTPLNGNSFLGSSTTFSFLCEVEIEGQTLENSINVLSPLIRTAYVKDVKSSGTNGGTFTSGAYRTRDLNTLEGDTSFISLNGSNQITLSKGKYEIEAITPGFAIQNHKCKIYNITTSADVKIGKSSHSNSGAPQVTDSSVMAEVDISSSNTYEIRHRCTNTGTNTGFGLPTTYGDSEVYTMVKITKVR